MSHCVGGICCHVLRRPCDWGTWVGILVGGKNIHLGQTEINLKVVGSAPSSSKKKSEDRCTDDTIHTDVNVMAKEYVGAKPGPIRVATSLCV